MARSQIFARPILAAACLVLLGSSARAADDEAAIRKARADSNAGIAAHDADRATAPTSEKTVFVTSGAGVFKGRAEMRAAFIGNFGKPDFITYVRTPSTVRVGGRSAAEEGRWVGRWRTWTISGVYMSRWDKTESGWGITSEMYIPLACTGQGCPP